MRISFRVVGQVQGIGYRWFVKETASDHHLNGWVRNVTDGSVEGEVQGPVPELNAFLKHLKNGNSCASVEKMETQELMDSGTGENDFYIKASI
ncbi:MAG: acylphosphatase [Elusimicrobia bacterium]|nr:acylphosphatase [Elusimicrobiota bacterium]